MSTAHTLTILIVLGLVAKEIDRILNLKWIDSIIELILSELYYFNDKID